MDQHAAYHNAFQHAKVRLDQLSGEFEFLKNRQAALLSATKALEVMIAQKDRHRPASTENRSAVPEIKRPATAGDSYQDRPSKKTVNQAQPHRTDSTDGMQRRIEVAIGR